ncbi:MAG: DNA-processing protein DprA [Gammaproteobacteria bacterium]|nr:DNA-processing protein DprA [Gammaproteobacteria bacterium]MCD8542377.1 DNA-processing protein DprA [Gammaproteobacteria bacterium]
MKTLDSTDKLYPSRLREIVQVPKTLFVQGEVSCLTKPCVAIVGTRKPSNIALRTTKEWATVLSNAGIVIVSGMALGIDGAAHQGALQGAAKTIAVLGCGVHVDYPKQHRELKQAIIDQGGCVVSEYPPDTPPRPANFPHRNRIISALSDGVIVMEAALKSGSLTTAKIAAEQGREVMAVPGSIHHPMTQGCHRLIREGATLVSSIQEVVECLRFSIPITWDAQVSDEKTTRLGKEERRLMTYIHHFSTPIDDIVLHSGLAFHEVCSMLITLELSGHVEKVAGGYRLL